MGSRLFGAILETNVQVTLNFQGKNHIPRMESEIVGHRIGIEAGEVCYWWEIEVLQESIGVVNCP